jgi:hypothetical protein
MFKVGQRVRVTSVETNPWNTYRVEDVQRYSNKIFKIERDMGMYGEVHGWRLDCGGDLGNRTFAEYQFRALKKKKSNAVPEVVIPNYESELKWLNNVQSNFKDAGYVLDEGPGRLTAGGINFDALLRRDTYPVPTPVRYQTAVAQDEPNDTVHAVLLEDEEIS